MKEITPEEISFFSGKINALPLYEAARDMILSLSPNIEIKVQKSQITFKERYGFAFISLKKLKGSPDVFILLTLGLGRRLASPRVAVAVEPYPGRWTHHIIISDIAQLDGEISAWMAEARDFALNK